VATERKKLTIFFSDIVDFTPTTERLQPEELTSLLNEYLTEMSAIAARHGGTVDKFIGDAIMIFFGDTETKGRRDATACLLRRRDATAARALKPRGEPGHRSRSGRAGINAGYCGVGNFGARTGSSTRSSAPRPGGQLQTACERRHPLELRDVRARARHRPARGPSSPCR
jgi:class 3 adenylate cyclase